MKRYEIVLKDLANNHTITIRTDNHPGVLMDAVGYENPGLSYEFKDFETRTSTRRNEERRKVEGGPDDRGRI